MNQNPPRFTIRPLPELPSDELLMAMSQQQLIRLLKTFHAFGVFMNEQLTKTMNQTDDLLDRLKKMMETG